MCCNTGLNLLPKGSRAGNTIGDFQLVFRGSKCRDAHDGDGFIEVVVDQVQLVRRICGSSSSVDGAGERLFGDIEWCLPHIRELVYDIRHGAEICLMIHKSDQPLSAVDHGSQSGPICKDHRSLGRDEGKVGKSSGLVTLSIGGCGEVVDVDNHKRHDFSGIGGHPCLQLFEVGDNEACIIQ